MSSRTKMLADLGLITPPGFLPTNIHYETLMGSMAYGVSQADSDWDIYGFCIPPKAVVFPHLAGEIDGFGRQKKRFLQYQQHHISHDSKSYDLSIYNVVRYFTLCMENNPNMIDSLYTPQCCVLHCTQVGHMVRDSRDLFLHKGSWHKFKGYAYSQLNKMGNQKREGKRRKLFDQYGYDVKFAYHTVRLLLEVEMILNEHSIDLTRHKEHLRSIRRGESTEAEIRQWASDKEKALERAYEQSSLRHSPDQDAIRQLLLDCLEHHYGSLSDAMPTTDRPREALRRIMAIAEGGLS